MQSAWDKYGKESFSFNAVEECDVEDLNEREIYWIDQYDSYINKNGYNLTLGGDGGRTIESETIEKIYDLYNNGFIAVEISEQLDIYIRTVHKYLKIGTKNGLCNYDAKKDMLKLHSKKIICLNTKRIFDSVMEAENEYNIVGIYECCIHKVNYCGKDNNGNVLFWMYYEEYENATKDEIESKINSTPLRYSFIICINDLSIFESATSALKHCNLHNVSSITDCCKGKIKYAGMIKDQRASWMYYKDYKEKFGEVS